MGIHSYEHFIQKLGNSPLKEAFVAIQKEQKNHATMIAERIQKLGGTPVTNEGIIGKIQAAISNLFEKFNTEEEIQNVIETLVKEVAEIRKYMR